MFQNYSLRMLKLSKRNIESNYFNFQFYYNFYVLSVHRSKSYKSHGYASKSIMRSSLMLEKEESCDYMRAAPQMDFAPIQYESSNVNA